MQNQSDMKGVGSFLTQISKPRNLCRHFALMDSSGFKQSLLFLIINVLFTGLPAMASLVAQTISLTQKNQSLSKVLNEIEKRSGFTFMFNNKDIDLNKQVSVDVKNANVKSAIDEILKGTDLSYEIINKTIVLKKITNSKNVKDSSDEISRQQNTINGRVLDKNTSKPIPGVTIVALDGSGKRTGASSTDANGEFKFNVSADTKEILVRSIGYKNVSIKPGKNLTIMMTVLDAEVEEVVVTGLMEVKKETFSGASSEFKAEELKAVGNTNVINALRSLDPSFLLMENNLAGSNPNVVPTIELRGQTSISFDNLQDEFIGDPNQPLFILDGFETTLRAIMDLDLNRVASITLLKDASSTAIYGSRASNGVVVVETIKPKSGDVRINYTADLNFQYADLSSYNMMNAAEKLEFERLSGVYTASATTQEDQYTYYDLLYTKRLESVLRGVDSYWLSEPIRFGLANRHSLYAEGGSEYLMFNVGGNYRKNNAVMKGSGRDDWGGRLNLTYRRNKVRINNNLAIDGYLSNESNYGSFSTWANLNPYYEKLSSSDPILDSYFNSNYRTTTRIFNPMYNTALNSYDNTENLSITNNFQIVYDISSNWKLQGKLQLKKAGTLNAKFLSPLHTDFTDVSPLLKGKYTSYDREEFSYTANAMVSYARSFLEKHMITAHGSVEFYNREMTGLGFTAQGFPTSSNGNPAFAYGYAENGQPIASNAVTRRNSFISNATYSYDQRYNLDFSFNMDGSTAFGSNNLYSPFYSIGGSWNMHKETFIKNLNVFSLLRARINYGETGNQNFSSSTSISTYRYLNGFNYLGQGVGLSTFGNRDLDWQNTGQLSAGIDMSMFGNRLNLSFNAYNKKTSNLVVVGDLPLSTGLVSQAFNAGSLTIKGFEWTSKYNFIYKPQERFTWGIGLTGSTYSGIYGGFDDRLKSLNQDLQASNALKRYKDGYDSNDIWLVRSLGIDPATGQEIFLNSNGGSTFDYSKTFETVVGNTRPAVQGVLSTNLMYKGFTFNAFLRYIYDQDVLNTALYNKVENISLTSVVSNNQDRRALYDRWKQPGDISEFKSISLTSTTPISSRFVQQENTLSFESISFGYEFRDAAWLKKVKLRNLKISGYTNDIFRLSTVKRERGIDYPYARSYSFTLNANF